MDLVLLLKALAANGVELFLLWLLFSRAAACLLGMARPQGARETSNRTRRYAFLVPAHDEETVIAPLLRSIQELDWPEDRRSVFVVADRCSDRTAEISRAAGARVLVRNDGHPSKGGVLAWATPQILAQDPEIGAMVFVDADNLVHPDFLSEVDPLLENGNQAVQGRVCAKNPADNPLTWNADAIFSVSSRMGEWPRSRLGLGASLLGKGMVFSREILEAFPWGIPFLVEDMEMAIRLRLAHCRVAWAHRALVYDEQPRQWWPWWRQRFRWTKGRFEIANRHFWGTLSHLVRHPCREAWNALEYCLLGYGYLLAALGAWGAWNLPSDHHLAPRILETVSVHGGPLGAALAITIPFWPAMALVLERARWTAYLGFALSPILALCRLPLWLVSLVFLRDKRWNRTPHHRAISIQEVLRR